MCEVTKLLRIMLSLSLKLAVILGDWTAGNTPLLNFFFFFQITKWSPWNDKLVNLFLKSSQWKNYLVEHGMHSFCKKGTRWTDLWPHLKLVEVFEDFSKRLPDSIDDVYEWQLNSCVRGNLRSKFQNWSALILCPHRG